MGDNSPRDTSLYQRLRREFGEINLVDAHEHLPAEEQWLLQPADLAMLLGYSRTDLVSAGMPMAALDPNLSLSDRWNAMRPYWPHVRNMGPGLLCRRALALFCGVQDLTDETVPAIQERLAALSQPGAYSRLMAQYRIAVCLTSSPLQTFDGQGSSAHSAPLLYTEPLALVQKRSDITRLEAATGRAIYSLKTYLEALDTLLERKHQSGFVGLKWHALAYLRDIDYPLADEHAAARCLDRILRMPAAGGIAADTPVGFDEMRPFQDLVQNHLVRRAIELDWPVQIHTGIFGGSYGAQLRHANPTHLVDLFLRYPRARFDLLHASYPYMRELTALVKMFPNVRINTAWLELLAPRAAKQYLREWISSVPVNKIHAFGADQGNILLACADAEMVRDNLADVLAEYVAEGNLSEDEALRIAAHWLRVNAWEYWRLQERWADRYGTSALCRPQSASAWTS